MQQFQRNTKKSHSLQDRDHQRLTNKMTRKGGEGFWTSLGDWRTNGAKKVFEKKFASSICPFAILHSRFAFTFCIHISRFAFDAFLCLVFPTVSFPLSQVIEPRKSDANVLGLCTGSKKNRSSLNFRTSDNLWIQIFFYHPFFSLPFHRLCLRL